MGRGAHWDGSNRGPRIKVHSGDGDIGAQKVDGPQLFSRSLIPAGSGGWSPRKHLLKGTISIILAHCPHARDKEPRAWVVLTLLCHFLSLSDLGPVSYSG